MKPRPKSAIEFHSDRGPSLPAVNVKCHHFPGADDICRRWPDCPTETAEKAAEYAYEQACECFWKAIHETAEYYLGAGVKVWQQGRSGGWLVVETLPAVETWDAIKVAAWWRFAAAVAADIAYRCKPETVFEEIECNRWHIPGAEKYNFIDRKDGGTVCLADERQKQVRAVACGLV